MARKQPILDDKTEAQNEKRENAKKCAKRLFPLDKFGRELEMSIYVEDDQELAGYIQEELDVLDKLPKSEQPSEPQQEGAVTFVNTMEDIDKLPSEAKAAMRSFVEQLGGIPRGGLIQVKMEDVESLDKAVDTLLNNGNINLSSIICSRLAAERANLVASAVVWLFNHALAIGEKAKKTPADKKIVDRINECLQKTFKDGDFKVAHALATELGAFEESKPAKKTPAKDKAPA